MPSLRAPAAVDGHVPPGSVHIEADSGDGAGLPAASKSTAAAASGTAKKTTASQKRDERGIELINWDTSSSLDHTR
jgi:hypothetical protein